MAEANLLEKNVSISRIKKCQIKKTPKVSLRKNHTESGKFDDGVIGAGMIKTVDFSYNIPCYKYKLFKYTFIS